MKETKYEKADLIAVARGDMTIQKCAHKYKTSIRGVYNAIYRNGLTIRKVRIKITTPYKTMIASSIEEASNELQCSTTTIKNALSGKRVRFMEREEITIRRLDDYGEEDC